MKFNAPTRHEIVVVDLSDPRRPRVRSRLEVSASEVVLARDASAYAVSRPSTSRDGQWETLVHWVDGKREDILLEQPITSNRGLQLSENAEFLAIFGFGLQLRVFDLRAASPTVLEQKYAFIQRYQCLVAIRENGQVIVEDARAPRLGFYEAATGLPRTAAIDHDGTNHCERLDFGSSAGHMLLSNQNLAGRIHRLDLSRQNAPQLSAVWQLPPRTIALAAAREHVYAAGGKSGSELLVFNLNSSSPPTDVWPVLEAAYRDALARYNQETRQKTPIPFFNFSRRMEDAGIAQGLDAPLGGFSATTAAAILNDYAFLKAKEPAPTGFAEAMLRRAIELDPSRAVARLNLADLLRDRLSGVSIPSDDSARITEVQDLYRQYLQRGGRSNSRIDAFLRGRPEGAADDNICRAIASYANAGSLSEIVKERAMNVQVGDHRVDFVSGTQGTAHVPVIYAFDAISDLPIDEAEFQVPGGDLWGGDQLGLVVYRGEAQILHFRDFRHPAATSPLSSGESCRFKAETIQRIGPKTTEPGLCKALMSDGEPPEIEFTNESRIDPELVRTRHRQTSAGPMQMVDFANDGKPGNLVLMNLSSTAGAGCESVFYDLLDSSGKAFASGPGSEKLTQLQNGNSADRSPITCGNSVRLFRHRGKVYFEGKPSVWPPRDEWSQYHRVARMDKGVATDVCDFKFETTVSSE